MPSDRGIALVTGGGRGIGANIARELAADGWSVVVAARTREQVESVAEEIGGRAIQLDVTDRDAVERAVAEAGEVELLVANAGIGNHDQATWELEPEEWWRDARGERARRAPLLPRRDPGHARTQQRSDRHHR